MLTVSGISKNGRLSQHRSSESHQKRQPGKRPLMSEGAVHGGRLRPRGQAGGPM